jgi:hypothetical protein
LETIEHELFEGLTMFFTYLLSRRT